jgi:hypothetical protein
MTGADAHGVRVLDALTRAVADALDRKRRLGQYFVVWRDGRVVCIGPDAPTTANGRHAAPVEAEPTSGAAKDGQE